MIWNVYLSGEIHTDWRNEIKNHAQNEKLNITFTEPVTNHEYSDDCGVVLTEPEEKKYWYDHKGAKINAIRTRTYIEKADIVIVRFGEKYKQWNAAFDAGYAAALNKSIIVIHSEDNQHALKEVDAAALAVVNEPSKIVDILKYVINSELK
jgi:YtoQ family protein